MPTQQINGKPTFRPILYDQNVGFSDEFLESLADRDEFSRYFSEKLLQTLKLQLKKDISGNQIVDFLPESPLASFLKLKANKGILEKNMVVVTNTLGNFDLYTRSYFASKLVDDLIKDQNFINSIKNTIVQGLKDDIKKEIKDELIKDDTWIKQLFEKIKVYFINDATWISALFEKIKNNFINDATWIAALFEKIKNNFINDATWITALFEKIKNNFINDATWISALFEKIKNNFIKDSTWITELVNQIQQLGKFPQVDLSNYLKKEDGDKLYLSINKDGIIKQTVNKLTWLENSESPFYTPYDCVENEFIGNYTAVVVPKDFDNLRGKNPPDPRCFIVVVHRVKDKERAMCHYNQIRSLRETEISDKTEPLVYYWFNSGHFVMMQEHLPTKSRLWMMQKDFSLAQGFNSGAPKISNMSELCKDPTYWEMLYICNSEHPIWWKGNIYRRGNFDPVPLTDILASS